MVSTSTGSLLPKIDQLYDGYIFDLDGTIWMTERLVEGAQETVAALRARQRRVIFLTNNSDGTRLMFADRLSELGVPAQAEEIVSTSYVMARYLSEQSPGCRCYVMGADPLREELVQAGLKLRDRPGDIDYVVLGVDRDFTYFKLQTAFAAIRAGARFVATNPDPYVPTARGDLADIGSEIAAIEVATGHKLDKLAGKPDPIIVEQALQTINLPREHCLMVGDQLGTDVLAAKRSQVKIALLLRDPRVVEQLADWSDPPDYGLNSLTDLIVDA
jgi:NagD protein